MANEILYDVASNLSVKTTTTPSYPIKIGINERNHATIDLMIARMLESDKNTFA